jgi:hypothetical protein
LREGTAILTLPVVFNSLHPLMTDIPANAGEAPAAVEQQPVLTIGDRNYPINSLPDEAQKLVLAVRDCEEQITQLKRRLNYLEIARRTLIQELTARLPN